MLDIIIGYACIILGSFVFGVAVAIYGQRKYRVIHDLITLVLVLIGAVGLIIGGIVICQENANNRGFLASTQTCIECEVHNV